LNRVRIGIRDADPSNCDKVVDELCVLPSPEEVVHKVTVFIGSMCVHVVL